MSVPPKSANILPILRNCRQATKHNASGNQHLGDFPTAAGVSNTCLIQKFLPLRRAVFLPLEHFVRDLGPPVATKITSAAMGLRTKFYCTTIVQFNDVIIHPADE